jgi:hypothetical protein
MDQSQTELAASTENPTASTENFIKSRRLGVVERITALAVSVPVLYGASKLGESTIDAISRGSYYEATVKGFGTFIIGYGGIAIGGEGATGVSSSERPDETNDKGKE